MEPTGCGIGGDLFAIVWDPTTERLYGYNGSGRAPAGRTLAQLKEKLKGADHIPPVGSLPVTVPGAVDGWFALHERFGRLEMKEVLQPAVRYATDGFALTPVIAYYWNGNLASFERRMASGWLEELDNARSCSRPNGEGPETGQRFRNPDLAATYQKIAAGGRAAFYEGEIAQVIDGYMKRIGGDLRLADLTAHRGEWVEPVSVKYRGYEVFELPPNTQGIAALQMLQMLEPFELAKMSEADRIHSWSRQSGLRSRTGHGSTRPDGGQGAVGRSARTVVRSRAKKADRRRKGAHRGLCRRTGARGRRHHLPYRRRRARDDGLADSVELSRMGSGLVPDGLGFMLQDRGELFTLQGGSRQRLRTRQTPLSHDHPGLRAERRQAVAQLWGHGGRHAAARPRPDSGQPDRSRDGSSGRGDAARWRHNGSSQPTGESAEGVGTLLVESGVSAEVRAALERKGHSLKVSKGGFGGYQAITWDPAEKIYVGASEMRKDGAAQGY